VQTERQLRILPVKIEQTGHAPVAVLNLHQRRYSLRIPSIADHHMISDSSPFANAFDELEFRVGSQSEQSPRLPSAGNSSQF